MSVDLKDERAVSATDAATSSNTPTVPPPPAEPRRSLFSRVSLADVNWRDTLLIAFGMALVWCLLFLATTSVILQVLAGIMPVSAGLILGRRIKSQYLLHGFILGLCGFAMGLGLVSLYVALVQFNVLPLTAQATQVITGLNNGASVQAPLISLILAYITLSFFPLIPFPAFGTMMAGRNQERTRGEREQIAARGGRLERPGTIRTADDLTGLSLPQLGSYVSTLFRKKGFTFKDYRFTDKDRHLDMWFEYEGAPWWLRLSVADKVRPGTVESLVQEMRKQNIRKGVVITNTEFTPDALKAGKARRSLVLIDAPTLFEMAES